MPVVWTVAAGVVEPADACRELARCYLHVFGPSTLLLTRVARPIEVIWSA